MDSGGRPFVSVAIGGSSMPPPLSSIPTSAGGGGGVGGTIVVKASTQQQQQQADIRRRKLSTHDPRTVVTVRNAAQPMITISSSTAPPLASFISSSGNIRPPLPLRSSASSQVSIDEREGTVFISQMKAPAASIIQQTASRQRDFPVPMLPKSSTGGTGTIPTVEIARKDPLPPQHPVQEIVIGQQQLHRHANGRFRSIQSWQFGPVQIGSTDIMSSPHQPTKIGQSTIVKQTVKAVPTSSHIIPVIQCGQQPIGVAATTTTTTTTTVLLPVQQQLQSSAVITPPHVGTVGVGEYRRLPPSPPTPTFNTAALKVYRPVTAKPLAIQKSTIVATASVPPPSTVVQAASSQPQVGNIIGAAGVVSVAAVGGPAVIVQPTPPLPPATSVSTTGSVVCPQQQPPSLYPVNPGQVHQHVLPFGTTIKVTSSGHDQQPCTLVPPVTGATSVIVPKPASQQQQHQQHNTVRIPVIKHQATVSKPPIRSTPVVVPPAGGPLCSIPPLYVPPTVHNAKAAASSSNGLKTAPYTPPTVATSARLVDGAGGPLISKRVTTSPVPQRVIVGTATGNSVIQQLKQHRNNATPKIPPVPKLAPFVTTALASPTPVQVTTAPHLLGKRELPTMASSVVGGHKTQQLGPPSREVISGTTFIQEGGTLANSNTMACAHSAEVNSVPMVDPIEKLDTEYEDEGEKGEREGEEMLTDDVEMLEEHISEGEEKGDDQTVDTIDEERCRREKEEEDQQQQQQQEQQQQQQQQIEIIELLDTSFDSNGNEPPQSTTTTPEKQDASMMMVDVEISRLPITPKKGATALTQQSSVSPRLLKRALSEQQPAAPQLVAVKRLVDNRATSGETTVSSSTMRTSSALQQAAALARRKRSESVHVRVPANAHFVRLNVDKATTFKQMLASAQTVRADLLVEGAVAVDEGKRPKRPPLKDATNEAKVEDGSGSLLVAQAAVVATKALLKSGQEKRDTSTGSVTGAQDNILLLCNEKFEMVSSSVVDGDGGGEERTQQGARRTSRRLNSVRRGLADSAATIKVDIDADEAARDGADGEPADQQQSLKRKKVRKDENSGVDNVVRSTSTSSESNMAMRKFSRKSLPEQPAMVPSPAAGAASTMKKSVKKSPVVIPPGVGGGQGRARHAGLRSSIAAPPSESSFSVTEDKDSKDGGGGSGGAGSVADTTTVSDHLRWHDGIGYLGDSLLHFEFNPYGLVQPITGDQYDRHCSTDVYVKLMVPFGRREPQAPSSSSAKPIGRKRRKSPEGGQRTYRCAVCLAKAPAVDFVTPEYCSIECVQQSAKPALLKYIQHSTHMLQHRHGGVLSMSNNNNNNRENAGEEEGEEEMQDDEEVVGSRSKKKKRSSKRAPDKVPDKEVAKGGGTAAARCTTTTPSTTTTPTTTNATTTSDEDSRSSLSLNSNAFVERPHLRSLVPTSPSQPAHALPGSPPDGEGGEAAAAAAAESPSNGSGGGDGGVAKDEDNDDDDDDTEVTADEFNWEQYLRHVKAEAAPEELFGRQPFPSTANRFRVGMKLEAIDPENCSLFCVCSVVEVRGFRLRLHFDGYPVDYDFWVNADSPDIFPPGWCRSTGRVLQPPSEYTGGGTQVVFRWKEYLLQTGATVPDHRWFAHLHKPPSTKNAFDIGMMLEADDLKKSGKVCVATVADKLGDRILVHFDGWDPRYDYWVSIHSPYIHPINWHLANNDKITPPPDWHKPFTWERYIRNKRYRGGGGVGAVNQSPILPATKLHFQTRAPVGFQLGQRVEVVDRKQQIRIRPATVVATDGYEVQVCFDGWPQSYAVWIEDDSPNIHPVSWCARTRHPLEPPPNYLNAIESCEGTCELRFCLGRGNAKFPAKKYHDRTAECPYRRSNWMSEVRKTLRISHNQVQKHITDVFSGLGLYEPVPVPRSGDQHAKVRPPTSVLLPSHATPMRSVSPRVAKLHQATAGATGGAELMGSAAARLPTSVTSGAPATASLLSKRIKQERSDDPSISSSSDLAATTSRQQLRSFADYSKKSASPPSAHSSPTVSDSGAVGTATPTPTTATGDAGEETTNGTTTTTTTFRMALPVIDGYGPRLLHAYEVWRENSRFLDECTERGPAGGELRMKNPLHWTTDETARYIEQLPGCDECATKIRHEEITGRSFLSFTQDDLVKYMGIKVGPAIKVYNRIIHLRQLVAQCFIQL